MAARKKKQHKVRDDASSPVCLVIAGPNGAGKTTVAREADAWFVYDTSRAEPIMVDSFA